MWKCSQPAGCYIKMTEYTMYYAKFYFIIGQFTFLEVSHSTEGTESIVCEVDRFLVAKPCGLHENPLQWWLLHEAEFPRVALVNQFWN